LSTDFGFGVPGTPEKGHALGRGDGALFLEELSFTMSEEDVPTEVIEGLRVLIKHQEAQERLAEQLVILNDNDFTWYARYGLAVQTRNVLAVETKESKNLWTEESLPVDTVMYCLLGERDDTQQARHMMSLIERAPYLQVGGNETTGQGWFAMQVIQ
jgi:CRISPR-associated protein Cmr4